MSSAKMPSFQWLAALAIVGLLILTGPSVLAEEEKAEEEKAPESGETETEAAKVLRVEQGRVLTNRDAGKPEPAPKKISIDEGQVITNELLEKIFGPSDEAATADPAQAPAQGQPAPDPLQVMRQGQMRQAERQRLTEEAQRELDGAKTKLANLEVQLLAARNPFSKRPVLSDDEKRTRETSGEAAAERAERSRTMVDEARAEVQAAEAKLARVRSGS